MSPLPTLRLHPSFPLYHLTRPSLAPARTSLQSCLIKSRNSFLPVLTVIPSANVGTVKVKEYVQMRKRNVWEEVGELGMGRNYCLIREEVNSASLGLEKLRRTRTKLISYPKRGVRDLRQDVVEVEILVLGRSRKEKRVVVEMEERVVVRVSILLPRRVRHQHPSGKHQHRFESRTGECQ